MDHLQSRSRLHLAVAIAIAGAGALAPRAEADGWSTGIGTGIFGLNIKGDVGLGTSLLGPISVDDLDLSTSDISDVTKSAAGLAGFSTNGVWTILYSGGRMELEDDDTGTTANGSTATATFNYKATKAELAAQYVFVRTERSAWGLLFGANFTKHDYETALTVGASRVVRSVDNDWTDAILGLTYAGKLSDRWTWSNRVDIGFGGSDGTYHGRTGFEWDAGAPRGWMFNLYADYRKIQFERSAPGATDWYKYDVAEFGPGLGFAYVFGGRNEPAAVAPTPPPPLPPVTVARALPPPPPPPPDADRDGVGDTVDQCPNTTAGDRVDSLGCGFNIRLEVLFDTNSATLKSDSFADLDRAVDLLKRVPTMRGAIEGHTDATGPDAYNQKLSERRAQAVSDYLVQSGIDRARVPAKGLGESDPIADNTTVEGRAQNRRVILHRADTTP